MNQYDDPFTPNPNLRFVAYCRKSSEEDGKQIQSLDTQERILTELSQKYNLKVVKLLREQKSAKDDNNRPLFNLMLEMIEKQEANAILVIHADRLSRNLIEAGKINKLFDNDQLLEIRTPYNRYCSVQDLLHIGFDFLFASHTPRDNSIKIKQGMDTKVNQGGWPGLAPIGYLNDRLNHTIYPDQIRAKYITRAFEYYASQKVTGIKQLEKTLYEQGFRSKYGYKVRKSTLARVLRNPVYYGIVHRHGKQYPGNHKPLISKSIWNKVQKLLDDTNRSKKQKHTFLYRDYLYCAQCGCKITATIKKGKYHYYYCTNGRGQCDQHRKYLNEDKVQNLVSQTIAGFTLDKKLAELSFKAYKAEYLNKQAQSLSSKTNLEKHLKTIEEKLEKLLDLYLSGNLTKEKYTQKDTMLNNEETELKLQIKKLKQQNPENTLELLEEIKNYCCNLQNMFEQGNTKVKSHILKSVLWNLKVKNGEVLEQQYKLPYAYLQNFNDLDDPAKRRKRWDSNPRNPEGCRFSKPVQ